MKSRNCAKMSESEIIDAMYDFIVSSEAVGGPTGLRGTVYKHRRPKNGTTEDAVVWCAGGIDDGQIQVGYLFVRIFVPDLDAEGEKIIDSRRVRELERLFLPLLKEVHIGSMIFRETHHGAVRPMLPGFHAIEFQVEVENANEQL